MGRWSPAWLDRGRGGDGVERTALFDALDGLLAYDVGATDSGIHDEALRQRVTDHLADLPDAERAALVRDFIGDQGYRDADEDEFLKWLRWDMRVRVAGWTV